MSDFDKLLKKASTSDKAELTVLYNAKVKTLAGYQEDPTASNKRDYDAAREGLEECVNRLLPIYLPKKAVITERSFATQTEARYYLQEIGYKVCTGKFSQDSKIFTGVGKQILLSDLMAYAKNHLDAPRGAVDSDELLKEEHLLDVKIKRAKLVREEAAAKKDDKNWIERSTVYEREGALIGQIMSEGRYQFSRQSPALIALCHGEPKYALEVGKQLDEALFAAFRNLRDLGEIDINFEEAEE